MADTQEIVPQIPVGPEKQLLLGTFEAGNYVLEHEAQAIRDAVDALNILSQGPTDEAMLPIAADVATDPSNLVTNAAEILPMIHEAVDPFNPKQTDPSRAATERWTKDWKAIGAALKARLDEKPGAREELTDWFLDTGAAMVETTYASGESKNPLYVEIGGANDQPAFRAVLALASMATAEFRKAHGLVTLSEHALNGEDGNEAGWLKNQALIEELRKHVAERVAAGEISPRIIVGGSADSGRILKEAEVNIVSKYFTEDTEPLYPERGWTEADAMLAGALRVFGRKGASPLIIEEYPSAEPDTEPPAKMISFESPVGPVTFVATTGSEANLASQLAKVYEHKPEIFDGVDALYGTTTAIYTWVQRPALLEAAERAGLTDISVETLGISAHAASITRNPEVLVGELTNFLKAVYTVTRRSLEAAEQNAKHDLRHLGGTAVLKSQQS